MKSSVVSGTIVISARGTVASLKDIKNTIKIKVLNQTILRKMSDLKSFINLKL